MSIAVLVVTNPNAAEHTHDHAMEVPQQGYSPASVSGGYCVLCCGGRGTGALYEEKALMAERFPKE